MSVHYPDVREEIIAHVEAAKSLEAFDLLRSALGYPAELSSEHMTEALLIFGQIAEDLEDHELSALARNGAANVEDADSLYAFAHAAYERELHIMSTAVLARANRLKPNTREILTELCVNLEALMRHEDACNVLWESPLAKRDVLCRYLLAYNTLMTGDILSTEELVMRLNPKDPDLKMMVAGIDGMLARAGQLRGHTPLDKTDLRGWHAVINGTLLLHLSPHGFDEPMRGRYAYVSDNYALIKDGIETLGVALEAAALMPDTIWAVPERGSQIVARAAGRIFGLPVRDWPQVGAAGPGLVVAYDLDAELPLPVIDSLSEHHPGQLLWAHASRWTDVFPFAPDITTFLYQVCVSPWGGDGMQVDPETGEVRSQRMDNAPVDEIALRIVEAERDPSFFDAAEPVTKMVQALAGLRPRDAAGMFRNRGARLRQRVGSPVRSARFS